MIEKLPASTDTCYVVRFSGKLHGAEYWNLIGQVESAVQAQGFLNMVLIMEDLDFPEWDAIKADAHFGLKDYRHLRRVALAGDVRWADGFLKLISPFTHAEEKVFKLDQLDEAIQWASSQAAG